VVKYVSIDLEDKHVFKGWLAGFPLSKFMGLGESSSKGLADWARIWVFLGPLRKGFPRRIWN